MDSGMIGKIQKSKQYAKERERINVNTLTVTFEGTHNSHQVQYHDGVWECDCDFFKTRGVCSHTMTLDRILVREAELNLELPETEV